MYKLRVIFTPSVGSWIRNAVRAVLPALVLLDVIELTPDQIAAIVIAVEALFTGAGQVTKHV
jgi:hypothetical protein